MAVLQALGLGAGDATIEIEDTYAAYGRWRGAVEDVEARMREYRRALSASGRARSERPVELVARQVWDELSIRAPRLPADRLPADAEVDAIAVARDFRPPEHEPMFGGSEVKAANGSTLDLGHYQRARYVGLLLELGFSSPLVIPRDVEVARMVCDAYDRASATLDRQAMNLAKETIGRRQAREAADLALRSWRNACHDAGMRGTASP
jgi:hypothetical protein